MLASAMTVAICAGCAVAIGLGTAIRFANLAKGLDRVGWLPRKWRTWLFPPQQH
jgi:hypothetical protein